jgi:4-amino-4-deoxy-L-arabinose transferase-like glycosyltransferase
MTTTLHPAEVETDPLELANHAPVRRGPRHLCRQTGNAADTVDPRWARPALGALLLATTVLYIWGLGAEGWANSFYSAAVQAGAKSWKAFFFGSFDASSFITVDKPPASLWIMELSARVFGLNSWSILVPEALEGVATVGILYATVRRWSGAVAGLLAGAVVALTPVAALMFRFNNPDALLVLLLSTAAYAMTRAIESGRTRWLVFAMGLIGTGFITKMMQAFLVVPGFALVYLIAGPPKLARRIGQLLMAAVALVVSAGWWVVAVELTPAADRPYIGGSQDNNLFNLIFGYNGFGRITGSEAGSAANQWGPIGWDRLFLPSFGSQISWLIPGALVLMLVTLWFTRRGDRTDRVRAAAILWGSWLLVTAFLLSYAKGIIHPYYTVALAPAVGALVGIGTVVAWRNRSSWIARISLAVAFAATTLWSSVLLGRSSNWMPELRTIVLTLGFATSAALLVIPLRRRLEIAVAATALVVALAGPAAYTIDTVSTAHSGSIPSAGPTQTGANNFGPGGTTGPGAAGAGLHFGAAGSRGGGTNPFASAIGKRARNSAAGAPPGAGGSVPGGGPAGSSSGSSTATGGAAPAPPSGTAGLSSGLRGAVGGLSRAGASVGGLLNTSTPSAALTKLLESNSSSYSWVAAVVGSNSAAGYQLATNDPVMSIGGFNGTDPAPSRAAFKADVAAGKIHYFIAGGGTGGGPGGRGSTSTSAAITSWVVSHYVAKTVGGVTVYDLSPTK